MEKIQTKSKFKYVIYGPEIKRNIEIFNIFNKDPSALVASFHLPCVRCYFDGENAWTVPSFAISSKTGVCLDYKWFSCNKKPVDIFLKYYHRGFTSIFNPNELMFIKKSIKEKDNNLINLPVQKYGVFNYWFDVPINNSIVQYIINLENYQVNVIKKRKDTYQKYLYVKTIKLDENETINLNENKTIKLDENETINLDETETINLDSERINFANEYIVGKKYRNEHIKNIDGSINSPSLWKILSHFK